MNSLLSVIREVRGAALGSAMSRYGRQSASQSPVEQGSLFNPIDLAPMVPVTSAPWPTPQRAVQPPAPSEPKQDLTVGQRVAIAADSLLFPGRTGKVLSKAGLGYAIAVDGVTGPPWPRFLSARLKPIGEPLQVAVPVQLAPSLLPAAPVAPQSVQPRMPENIPPHQDTDILWEWRWWPEGYWLYAGHMAVAKFAQPRYADGVFFPHSFNPNRALGIKRAGL